MFTYCLFRLGTLVRRLRSGFLSFHIHTYVFFTLNPLIFSNVCWTKAFFCLLRSLLLIILAFCRQLRFCSLASLICFLHTSCSRTHWSPSISKLLPWAHITCNMLIYVYAHIFRLTATIAAIHLHSNTSTFDLNFYSFARCIYTALPYVKPWALLRSTRTRCSIKVPFCGQQRQLWTSPRLVDHTHYCIHQ